jgi:hypothetical protein
MISFRTRRRQQLARAKVGVDIAKITFHDTVTVMAVTFEKVTVRSNSKKLG